jgi:aminoglycoside phosphotransferase (APT) family kinase protein
VHDDGMYVQAHSRLDGSAATHLSAPTATALGEFLADLHSIDSFDSLDEFDPRTERVGLADYLARYPSRFAEKLRPGLAPNDRWLVEAATAFISRRITRLPPGPPLVLLHKDLHPANILLSDERLTGVVDWEACQTGPREWEFAILRQRFPGTWDVMARAYGRPLDPDLLDVFGVLQSLRFWKSFPHHDAFAREQREHISWILSNHGEI